MAQPIAHGVFGHQVIHPCRCRLAPVIAIPTTVKIFRMEILLAPAVVYEVLYTNGVAVWVGPKGIIHAIAVGRKGVGEGNLIASVLPNRYVQFV
jgi:hypothetical protein